MVGDKARRQVRRFIAKRGGGSSHYQSRTGWEITKELRRIEQSRRDADRTPHTSGSKRPGPGD